MGMRTKIGVAASAAAVAAVGAIGVWMGLAATSVPTVDLGETVNDTITVTTGTIDSGPAVEWRLHRNGDVIPCCPFGAATPGEGLARWTDPSGQTFMQLLLLLSGALIGVAASLAVERLFSWTLRLRESSATASATAPDAEGAPPEGDAP